MRIRFLDRLPDLSKHTDVYKNAVEMSVFVHVADLCGRCVEKLFFSYKKYEENFKKCYDTH